MKTESQENSGHAFRFFAALYVSEVWHAAWRCSGRIGYKARAVVQFDRVLNNELSRIEGSKTA